MPTAQNEGFTIINKVFEDYQTSRYIKNMGLGYLSCQTKHCLSLFCSLLRSRFFEISRFLGGALRDIPKNGYEDRFLLY